MPDEIINRIANSPLITLDLEEFYPKEELALIDIKDQLFKELILKERDFRMFVKTTDWSQYENQYVGVYCSSDAIVPYWAYMLVSNALEPYAKQIGFGNQQAMELLMSKESLSKIDVNEYQDKKVIIKGCGDHYIPIAAYVEITRLLSPVVQSLMYGEPCSTVPIYKKKK